MIPFPLFQYNFPPNFPFKGLHEMKNNALFFELLETCDFFEIRNTQGTSLILHVNL